jgi:hypothetical protein
MTVQLGGQLRYRINFSDKNHDGSRFVDIGIVNTAGALKF